MVMLDTDKNQFKTLMVGLGEIYGKEITKPVLQFYFNAFKSYSIEQVSYAANQHAVDPKHGTFFPKPADIVRHLSECEHSSEDKALLAWSAIEGAIRKSGAYGSLEIEDKQALAAVKAIGGWRDLCHTNIDQMQWKRKEFMSVYQTYDKTPVELLPQSLPGIEDIKAQKKKDNAVLSKLADMAKPKYLDAK